MKMQLKTIYHTIFTQDVIGNENMKLDWMFKSSLISDLVNVSIQVYMTEGFPTVNYPSRIKIIMYVFALIEYCTISFSIILREYF